jgi:hypothetical protein
VTCLDSALDSSNEIGKTLGVSAAVKLAAAVKPLQINLLISFKLVVNLKSTLKTYQSAFFVNHLMHFT